MIGTRSKGRKGFELMDAIFGGAGERGEGGDDVVVEVRPPERVNSVEVYDAVVLGGAAYAGVRLGSVHIFHYYRHALRTIVEEGLLSFLWRTSTPYLMRASCHFDPRSSTYSERVLGSLTDGRSPVGSQTTPQAGASEEENAAHG